MNDKATYWYEVEGEPGEWWPINPVMGGERVAGRVRRHRVTLGEYEYAPFSEVEVLSTPEPEPSDEPEPKPTTLFEAIYLWHGIDFNTQGGLTMRDAESLLGAVLAVAPVEVTRDELAKVIYEANTYSKPQWEYTLDSADRKITWAENAISDARNRADQALKEFRVSRRDGEDKNND